jgi:hypothetical protein
LRASADWRVAITIFSGTVVALEAAFTKRNGSGK